ncbi:MAG: DDE-type integrase/transposase/recombinase, partial [Candidatus Bathyarchaeia archaeon]
MIPDIEVINFQLLKASSNMPVTTVCKAFGIARSVFYYRKHRYERYGLLRSISKRPKHTRAIGKEIIAKIEEMRKTNGWKASRIARELLKQGVRLSEKTVRKYIPKKIEIKPVKKFKKEYEKLEQLQLDVKGRIYIGKNKLYPIGVIDRGTRVALSELKHSFKADSVIALCKQFIGSYGKPKAIKTDNHSVFRSKRFNAWLERNGIAHKYI